MELQRLSPETLVSAGSPFNPESDFRRIGLLLLATDLTTEQDFRRMGAHPLLRFHVGRIAYANPVTPENLQAMTEGLNPATDLIAPGAVLQAVYYSCTAASAVIGDEVVVREIRKARPGVSVITPLMAARQAFAALSAKRISVLTPYTAPVSREVTRYFTDHGFRINRLTCLEMEDDREMARLRPEALIAAAESAVAAGDEALFLSCTALRSAETAGAIERQIGIPVVTSNQAGAWAALCQAGIPRPDPCVYGQLMSL